MSHGAQKRSQALARQVYGLSQIGYTHREIAEAVGKRPEQISNLVALGERLRSLDNESSMNDGSGK